MADKVQRLMHEQAAYEAALYRREKKRLEEELDRYKRNLGILLSNENSVPSDYEGCVD